MAILSSHRMVDAPSDPGPLREAIAVIKAEHGVSETRAYAILIRAAAGCPSKPVDHHHLPRQRAPLAS
jgi:hypothetical protein